MARHYHRWWLSGFVALLSFMVGSPLYAEDFLPKAGTWETGIRTGYNWGIHKHVGMIPVNLRVGYTLFNGKWWLLPAGAFEIGAEPFASVITSVRPKRHGSMELGAGLPVVTYYFATGTRFAPYVEAGLGMLYTDLRGYTLGGHFSFMEEAGLGGVYFLDKNLVFSASWRYRHISNAYLYEHNAGLDSWMILAGFSYFLPQ